jgi:glyoxylase-like metal-dependent hydrolase (beta-lactamase superfamily II)
MTTPIPFLTEPEPSYGQPQSLSPLVRRVVAKNPGPYTYHGTGTYLIGRGHVAVLDAGPDDPQHVEAVLAALQPGEHITHLVVTHTHPDHSPAARALQARTGAPIYGFGPQVRMEDPDSTRVVFDDPDADPDPAQPSPPRGGDRDFVADERVGGGDVIQGVGWTLDAVHTPGHASNHLCYHLREDGSLLTGDHVMGWSSSVVSPPDGRLGEYMASLEQLLERQSDRRYLPAHGPPIANPHAFAAALLLHRQERSEQIMDALEQGPSTIAELVKRMYQDVRKQLWPAAASSVHAHLLDLYERGLVDVDDGPPVQRSSRFRQHG